MPDNGSPAAPLVTKPWMRWAALALACAPFCVACIAGRTPEPPRGLSDLREFPPIAFAQYSVNFGEVPPMPVIDIHFDFVNRSNQPIEILELKPSCNCLDPTMLGDQWEYGPGEAGRFYAQVQTASEPAGPQDYLVEMTYRSADDRVYSENLIFRVTLPELKVTVEPTELLFYQLSGEAGTRTIHVTDFRDEPLSVTGVVCDSPHATFEIGETVVDEHGRSTIPIQVNVPEGLPPMREVSMISIRTTDAEFSQISVPMLIHGPLQSESILPASSILPAPMPVDSTDAPSDADGSE